MSAMVIIVCSIYYFSQTNLIKKTKYFNVYFFSSSEYLVRVSDLPALADIHEQVVSYLRYLIPIGGCEQPYLGGRNQLFYSWSCNTARDLPSGVLQEVNNGNSIDN